MRAIAVNYTSNYIDKPLDFLYNKNREGERPMPRPKSEVEKTKYTVYLTDQQLADLQAMKDGKQIKSYTDAIGQAVDTFISNKKSPREQYYRAVRDTEFKELNSNILRALGTLGSYTPVAPVTTKLFASEDEVSG